MRVETLAALIATLMSGACGSTPPPPTPTPTPNYRVATLAQIELECSIHADRSISECRIVRENPTGAGAGFIEKFPRPDYRVPEAIAQTAKNGKVSLTVPLMLIPPLQTP